MYSIIPELIVGFGFLNLNAVSDRAKNESYVCDSFPFRLAVTALL
jgi:hypothetical protein